MAWLERPAVRPFIAAGRWLVLCAVFVFLLKRVSDIGWAEVWRAFPANPWFYVLFAAAYLTQPAADMVVHGLIWKRSLAGSFPAFLRRRVYNFGVVGYSGEAYFILWARRHLNLSGAEAFSGVKDSNILSALASNGATIVLLGGFFLSAQFQAFLAAVPAAKVYVIIAAGVGGLMVPLVLRFGRTLIALPRRAAQTVFAIHAGRLLMVLLLQAAQWSVALPEAPFGVWLTFLTAYLVLTRIPFLPNKDLMFAALAISLAGMVNMPEAAIAGVFLAAGALTQIANAAVYAATSFSSFAPEPAAEPQAAPRPVPPTVAP